jgi:predicted peroxiredoxin
MTIMAEKMVIFATHGAEDPEMATLPFVVANAALAMDVEVTVVLQANGVTLATKGMYEHILFPAFDPLKKLVDLFIECGGGILCCVPCLNARQIVPELVIEKVQLVKAAVIIEKVLQAKSVLNY